MMHSELLKDQAVGDSSGVDMWREKREDRSRYHDGSRRTEVLVSFSMPNAMSTRNAEDEVGR
jgi:hypothetical protein